MSKVVVAGGDGALDAVFAELGLGRKLEGAGSVLIKPNLRAAGVKNFKKCAVTSIDVVRRLARRLKALGLDVSVGESTSSRHITRNALKNSGAADLEAEGVKVLNLNECRTRKVEVAGGRLKSLSVPEPVLDAGFVISLPVMKTHLVTGVTLSLKNMVGATGELEPSRMHYLGIDECIADINTVIKPDLSIIDATRCMEGTGPVRGREVKLDTLIAGFDPVSVDAVGAKLIGFEPQEVKHLMLAQKLGVGKIEPTELAGELKVKKFLRPGQDGVTDSFGAQSSPAA